jgi:hypothetical protein
MAVDPSHGLRREIAQLSPRLFSEQFASMTYYRLDNECW